MKEAYFDRYEGIQSEISQVTRFDESTYWSTTYLGRINQTRKSVIRAEESFPISGQGYTVGKLSDKTDCSVLIDMGASQSYMSKSFYMQSRILHALPKFAPTTQRIQVGKEQYVAVLLIVPVIIEIHDHLFEVFTLVSEIHDNVDLVLGMKNAYELEGIIDMRDSSFRFLNRSIPFFSKEQAVVKLKEKKFIKIEAQKLEPPVTVKGCRSFAGMVNFLSIFCQDLQKLLKPIYDLTRKGRPFNWQQEQQAAFEEIKSRLQKPPILHLPDGKGRFHLYSDMSKYATGSALYQIQKVNPN